MSRALAGLLINAIALLLFISPAWAWDDGRTHKDLSKSAAEHSVIGSTDYLAMLGFAKKLEHRLKIGAEEESIIDWIRSGGELEDAGNVLNLIVKYGRSTNHFHNPNKPWLEAGLNDVLSGKSSLIWAQDGSYQAGKIEGDWSWQKVRTSFYLALTATADATRQEYFAQTFRGLGHQIHLVQDKAVPYHVRNDAHPLDSALGKHPEYGPYFETWAKEKYVKIREFAASPKYPAVDTRKSIDGYAPITQFIDTTNGNIATQPSVSLAIGLSEYTNANFMSEDTIFTEERSPDDKHYFPYPRKSSTNLQDYIDQNMLPEVIYEEDGQEDVSFWIKKDKDGEIINYFAKPGYFFRDIDFNVGGYNFYTKTLYLDEKCHEEYAKFLVPRAVGYSAGLLNYFFRGVIEISLPDNGVYAQAPNLEHGQGFTSFTVKARNTTANGDAMTNGDIRLVIRYREALMDPFLISPVMKSKSYSYIVSPPSNTRAIPNDSAVELTFDLTQSPLPKWATDITIQVVYYGELGAEANGVAVGYKDISEPTPVDIYNDMGMTCLYQNWYTAGSPEAQALAGSNQWDVYPHDLEVYIRFSPAGTDDPSKRNASPQNYHFHITPPIPGNTAAMNHTRKPVVISDYTYQTSFYFRAIPTHQSDSWQHVPWLYNRTTTAIKNQTEYSITQERYIDTQPNLCFYRDAKMWFDAGAIVISEAYPYNTVCSFEQVITCP